MLPYRNGLLLYWGDLESTYEYVNSRIDKYKLYYPQILQNARRTSVALRIFFVYYYFHQYEYNTIFVLLLGQFIVFENH